MEKKLMWKQKKTITRDTEDIVLPPADGSAIESGSLTGQIRSRHPSRAILKPETPVSDPEKEEEEPGTDRMLLPSKPAATSAVPVPRDNRRPRDVPIEV